MESKNIISFYQDGIGELRGFLDEKTQEPWFFAGKVCKCLKLDNSSKELSRLKENHLRFGDKLDGVAIRYLMVSDNLGRKQKTAVINEALMYELIFHSRTEKAFLFQQWIFKEVLPELRKHGSYCTTRKLVRRSLTDTIKSEIVDKSDNPNAKFSYSNFSILINKSLGLPSKIENINALPDDVQIKLAKRQDLVRCLIDEGKSFLEIKNFIDSFNKNEEVSTPTTVHTSSNPNNKEVH